MLRIVVAATVVLAIAGPALADDDMDACRDRQTEAKARLDACEKVIAAGQVTGKDVALANAVRGQAFTNKRNYDKAIAAFDAAHAADPDNPGYVNARGWAYAGKGDDDHALADYALALQMRPNFAVTFNDRGMLQLRKGAFQSALDDFNAAVNSNANLYLARINRGHVLTMTGDFDGALADLTQAEQIDSTKPQTATIRCETYLAMGKFDDAITNCNIVIEKAPKYQFALVMRANAYYGQGRLRGGAQGLQYRARL